MSLGERLGDVDSRDSLLEANQIQGCFLGGSLGCEGPIGFERRGVGADGALINRSAPVSVEQVTGKPIKVRSKVRCALPVPRLQYCDRSLGRHIVGKVAS
jgi:hypothetical protein